MCFLHAEWHAPITRSEALQHVGLLGMLPLMPQMYVQPKVEPANRGREHTAIVGATAYIGDDLHPLRDATVLIHRERIVAAGPAASVTVPPDAYRIDAHGAFVTPGLIDSHVHFFQSGGLYTRPDAIDLRSVRPYTDEIAWVKANLHDAFARYLRAGITSVVDVGGPFWNYDVRAEAARTALAPRVMVAGPLISSVDREILNPLGDPPIVRIDSDEAARALIDREIAQHTDYVKFWWVVTAERPAIAFKPIAERAIAYAHERGARVVIHATELETARLAVESGTDILAHSVFDVDVDDAFVDLLRRKKTIYCPTLLVSGNYGYTFHGTPNLTAYDLEAANPDVVATLFQIRDVEQALPADRLARIRALRVPEPPHAAMRNLKRIHDGGIVVAAATDAGNIGTQHASSLFAEALAMVASGLTPRDVLLSATRGGAKMMGRNDLGTIAPGKLADVVVMQDDPMHDVKALTTVAHVVKDGNAWPAGRIAGEGAEHIVQRQINAVNAGDATTLARTYAPHARLLGDGTVVEGQTAIASFFAKRSGDARMARVSVLARDVHGNQVTQRERLIGADGSVKEFSVRYRVEQGAITEAAFSAASSG